MTWHKLLAWHPHHGVSVKETFPTKDVSRLTELTVGKWSVFRDALFSHLDNFKDHGDY